MAQAIALGAALFRLHFPDAPRHLTPWREIPSPVEFRGGGIGGLAFHFPGWETPASSAAACWIQLRPE